jgi:hypothetical protein
MADDVFPTYEQFRDWLQTQPSDKIVGYPKDACRCPLATYLNTHGGANAHVYPTMGETKLSGHWSDDVSAHPLPNWADAFARQIDATFVECVTAELASKILEMVEAPSPV